MWFFITVDEALATDVSQTPQESPKTRELFNEDFESESEEQVLERRWIWVGWGSNNGSMWRILEEKCCAC